LQPLPYLIPQIKKILPDHIQIIDSGQAVAKQTQNYKRKVGFTNGTGSENIFIRMQIKSASKIIALILSLLVKTFKVKFSSLNQLEYITHNY
jgi:glutamate racemase